MKKSILIILFIICTVLAIIASLAHYNLSKYDISLIGEKEIEVPVNAEYKDEGVKATYKDLIVDSYTTDNNVDTSKIGNYEVVYKIKNKKVKRKVHVVDKEKPTIKLKNTSKIQIVKNSKVDLKDYIEAEDNYDGKLLDKVEVSGDFNPKKEGTYKVKYTVSDSSDNKETLETEIRVQSKNTTGIPVLMYHWFYDDTKGEKPGETNSHNYIAKTEFEKQMKYLKDNNYYYPTWQELIDYIDNKIDLPKKSIILTDDDCLQSFFDVALPVFQKYEVPFTSFCITKRKNWQKYVGEEYLTFQSHTDRLHQRICKGSWDGAVMCKDYDTINNDIKTSVEKVKNSDSFAYPFGHYNDNTIKALKANGIKLAFTIKEGRVKRGNNKYKLSRVRISRWTSLNTFKELVK